MLAGDGDLLPGQRPAGRRHLPDRAPPRTRSGPSPRRSRSGTPTICIDCGKCAIVCPHAAIRMKVFEPGGARRRARRLPVQGVPVEGPRRATGSPSRWRPTTAPAAACASTCARPRRRPRSGTRRSTWSRPTSTATSSGVRWDFFDSIPPLDRDLLPHDTVKGSQVLEPLFEFSGACAGCGETPYLKLAHPALRRPHDRGQRHRLLVDLRRQPAHHAVDDERRGPGPGLDQLAVRGQRRVRPRHAPRPRGPGRAWPALLVARARPAPRRATSSTGPARRRPGDRARHRGPARPGRRAAHGLGPSPPGRPTTADGAAARHLLAVADALVRTRRVDRRRRRLGLRHRLRRPRPRAGQRPQRQHARARHRGVLQHRRAGVEGDAPRRGRQVRRRRARRSPRRTSAPSRRAYGNVYVAQIAIGANDVQAAKALLEADAWPGPSLVIAYSTCIAHGIDMSKSMSHQKDAVRSGYWPLYRFHPTEADGDGTPFQLDSQAAVDAGRRLRRHRGPLRRARAHATPSGPPSWRRCSRPTSTSAGATTSSWPGSSARSVPHGMPEPGAAGALDSVPVQLTADAATDDGGGPDMSADLRTTLPRARPALADRRLGRPADRATSTRPAPSSTPAPAPSCCRRCSRRRSSTSRSGSTTPSRPAPSTSPRRSTTSPTFARPAQRGRPLPAQPRGAEGRGRRAGDRQPQRRPRRGVGAATPRRLVDAGADAIELNLYSVAADPRRSGGRGRGREARRSSPTCGPRSTCPWR